MGCLPGDAEHIARQSLWRFSCALPSESSPVHKGTPVPSIAGELISRKPAATVLTEDAVAQCHAVEQQIFLLANDNKLGKLVHLFLLSPSPWVVFQRLCWTTRDVCLTATSRAPAITEVAPDRDCKEVLLREKDAFNPRGRKTVLVAVSSRRLRTTTLMLHSML